MNSFSFTMQSHPQWTQHIRLGLRRECEALTGISENFPLYELYATQNDLFIGGIILEHFGEVFWLDALWVSPDMRGQGLGKQLLDKSFRLAARLNAREVQLNTYFEQAHHFFLNNGFEDVACIPNWKYDRACYLMRKELSVLPKMS